SYDDGGWEGEGPGLLWIDSRGNPRAGVSPANTPLPANAGSGGFPFSTYFFRTRFDFPGDPAGVALVFTNYLDDGAVFYLNGTEIRRFRMEEAPATIEYDALATSFGCDGDATCPEVFVVPGDPATPLKTGENVLAVRVHNYNARSPDITFGLSLTARVPILTRPVLAIRGSDGGVVLEWSGGGFVLQEAATADGPWSDVPGPVIQGPFRVSAVAASKFFRLRRS
ncbi:MAG: hypothetical protein JNL97_12335, partial [Verrucomicrobiales bacterium]|nr:hypothetical protein [Verrucomicrobiales bacterium]